MSDTWTYDHEVWAGPADYVAEKIESDSWLRDGYPDLEGCMVRVTLEWWRPIKPEPTHGTVEEEMKQNGYFECHNCGKMHGKYSGTACECGEPFPYGVTYHVCRS
jgi:hypothetical protein